MISHRNSIHHQRKNVGKTAWEDVAQFSQEYLIILHWDGKLFPDIKRKTKLDRIAILVQFNSQNKLIGVPKMEHGTGEAHAKAYLQILRQCKVDHPVRDLIFACYIHYKFTSWSLCQD